MKYKRKLWVGDNIFFMMDVNAFNVSFKNPCTAVVAGYYLIYLPFFSRVLRDSTTRFVGPSVSSSVCRSVRPSNFTIFCFFLRSSASLLPPKWCIDLNYGSCPSDQATGVAVYPALFLKKMTFFSHTIWKFCYQKCTMLSVKLIFIRVSHFWLFELLTPDWL